MLIRKIINDYLSFSKKDRIGILSVLALTLIIYLVPRFYSKTPKGLSIKQSSLIQQAIDSLSAKEKRTPVYEEGLQGDRPHPPSGQKNGELFTFDPNTLSSQGWRRLGLSERTTRTIIKYLSKGGKFYKPQDLQKIWGLPKGFYERVKDHIRIPAIEKEPTPEIQGTKVDMKKEPSLVMIDINEADTTLLERLPGIGSRLAARIVSFREKLGGYYSVEQIKEVYGLPDSTMQKIRTRIYVKEGVVQKLSINSATKEELKSHPYLKWALANAIVEYRTQHGDFKTVDELRKIALIDEATYKKMLPYLSL